MEPLAEECKERAAEHLGSEGSTEDVCGVPQCGQPTLPETDFQSKRPCRHQEGTRIDQDTGKGHRDVLIFNFMYFMISSFTCLTHSNKVLRSLSHSETLATRGQHKHW